MGRAVRRSRKRGKRIARERIIWLLSLADAAAPGRPDLAKRYGELARRISLRARVKIPRQWRWRYCGECKSYLVPGVNAVVRIRPKRMPHLVIHCLECGAVTRRPYLRERRLKLRFKMPAEGGPE